MYSLTLYSKFYHSGKVNSALILIKKLPKCEIYDYNRPLEALMSILIIGFDQIRNMGIYLICYIFPKKLTQIHAGNIYRI